MKKKNQELEKFKFVLDYKIKELKKQIEPRENDIKQMKDQIQEVWSLYTATYHLVLCIPLAHMYLDNVCYRVDYVNVFSMCDTW